MRKQARGSTQITRGRSQNFPERFLEKWHQESLILTNMTLMVYLGYQLVWIEQHLGNLVISLMHSNF